MGRSIRFSSLTRLGNRCPHHGCRVSTCSDERNRRTDVAVMLRVFVGREDVCVMKATGIDCGLLGSLLNHLIAGVLCKYPHDSISRQAGKSYSLGAPHNACHPGIENAALDAAMLRRLEQEGNDSISSESDRTSKESRARIPTLIPFLTSSAIDAVGRAIGEKPHPKPVSVRTAPANAVGVHTSLCHFLLSCRIRACRC